MNGFPKSKVLENLQKLNREDARAFLDTLRVRREKAIATARSRKGRKVRSLRELCDLASARRSVFVEGGWGCKPASVIVNLAARQVHDLITRGLIHRYKGKFA